MQFAETVFAIFYDKLLSVNCCHLLRPACMSTKVRSNLPTLPRRVSRIDAAYVCPMSSALSSGVGGALEVT